MFVNTSTVQHWLSPNLQTMIEMCETCRKKPGTTMPDEEEEEGEKRETIGIQPGGGDASPRQALEILAIVPTKIEFHTSQLHPPPPPTCFTRYISKILLITTTVKTRCIANRHSDPHMQKKIGPMDLIQFQ